MRYLKSSSGTIKIDGSPIPFESNADEFNPRVKYKGVMVIYTVYDKNGVKVKTGKKLSEFSNGKPVTGRNLQDIELLEMDAFSIGRSASLANKPIGHIEMIYKANSIEPDVDIKSTMIKIDDGWVQFGSGILIGSEQVGVDNVDCNAVFYAEDGKLHYTKELDNFDPSVKLSEFGSNAQEIAENLFDQLKEEIENKFSNPKQIRAYLSR